MHAHQHKTAESNVQKMGLIDRIKQLISSFELPRVSRKQLGWLGLPLVAAISFLAISQSTPPSIPAISLAADPLYAPTVVDKPAMALALSVEFPTVGAQYVDVPNTTTDGSYSNDTEYLGYYNTESCYNYNKSPTETPVAPLVATDYRRFDRTGAAIALAVADTVQPFKTSRKCTDAFSGNFLNWASNSAIDMLRMALTGGDRTVDTAGTFNADGSVITYPLTLLQRAVIPNGDPMCMWNSSNFPAKQLKKAGGASGANYFGAVPNSMATAAGTNDIWVANTLNRIYFSTSATGDCSSGPGVYTLGGAPTSSSQHEPLPKKLSDLVTTNKPSGIVACTTGENMPCTFTGKYEVWYGAKDNGNNKWYVFAASDGVTCDNATIGDPWSGVGKQCYIRPYTGSWTPVVTSAGSLNDDGFFYSRVQVCNVNSAGVLQDSRDYGTVGNPSELCKKYPNGNYKPTGVIQKYSDQMRLAAFGYLMDQTASYNSGGRYGGVLRAPMKYVGAKTFDINGTDNTASGGNPNREWSDTTGVFVVNPDSDATYGKSGVVSYVNMFGRTGPVAGRYKRYDPVGELHYETIRYLQGLQPSADAVSSITTDMYDGYPVYTSWTDPYAGRSNSNDYSCVKSNVVVIGDVNTHDGNRLPTLNVANNIPDINAWRTVVQNFEKNTSSTYIDGQGASRTTGNPNGSNGSVPSGTGTSQIMGSAYWAHTHDIRGTGWTASPGQQRPGLRVKSFLFDVNEYAQQSAASTRRTSNQFFMAAKYGGFETDASNLNPKPYDTSYNTWGNPFKKDSGTVDKYVWEDTNTDTSRVGEANTYFQLGLQPRNVLNAFEDIFARASTANRSIAGGAIQSKNLTQVGTTIFQGKFDTSNWTGELLAIPVSVSTSNVVTVANVKDDCLLAVWCAAKKMASLTAPATSRNIIVGNAGATAIPVAVPFSWALPAGTDGIETSLRTALDKPTPTSAADGLAQDRLNYLRGSNAKEGNPFRSRKWLLGDIVNSGVAYSGAPSTSISGTAYSTFYSTNAARTPAVFVGANDGMLHAFNGGTGDELFAYIPSWLGPKLPALTNANYVNNHQSYMDGTPVVSEAEVGSGTWKTILVSGTGGGGQGVFALDVTNPSTFTASNVMWEFTDTDDPDLGNVTGRPQILKLRTSATGGASATYKWFAVFGSGVNNYVNDGHYSTTGSPALFILDLAKPAGDAWALGTNYYKVSLPIDVTLSSTNATGLINFKAALGAAREVTQIFMGDLHGNLWKLDFTLVGIADWNINKLSYFKKGTTPVAYPMFIATDSTSPTPKVQPITAAPSIAFGPTPDSTYIMFGTGKYLEVPDKTTTAVQSAYMVFDNGTTTADSSPAGASAISGRMRLKPASSVDTTTGVVTVPAFTLGRATTNTSTDNPRSGWYFDFPASKEREISNATVFNDKIIFGTLIPAVSGTAGTCSASGGGGNQYTINIATGNGSFVTSTTGILGEPLVAEISSATTYTPSDSTGRRLKTVTKQVFQQGSGGVEASSTASATFVTGRLSWRQINNYQYLKDTP
jgi:type IV pilus assembly protein PilY1